MALALPPPPGCLPRLLPSPPQPDSVTPELPLPVLITRATQVWGSAPSRRTPNPQVPAQCHRGAGSRPLESQKPQIPELPHLGQWGPGPHPGSALSIRGESGCCPLPQNGEPHLPGPHQPAPAWQPAKNTATPFALGVPEGQAPDPWPFPAAVPIRSRHPARLRASGRPGLRSKLVGRWASGRRLGMESRCARASPGSPAGGPGEAGRGGRVTRSRRREGHRGVWAVDCWAEFLNLSFFLSLFLKKKPPSCVIIFMGSAILAKICL